MKNETSSTKKITYFINNNNVDNLTHHLFRVELSFHLSLIQKQN